MRTVKDICQTLNTIAPLHLAEDWDNVGLLHAPHTPRKISNILLTIDLTQAVVDEAIRKKSNMIIAYHPPIFGGLKRIDGKHAQLIENRIAVYSPHTALDATVGGVNDFLCDFLGLGHRQPITPALDPTAKINAYKIVVFCPLNQLDRIRKHLASDAGCGQIGDYEECSFNLHGYGTFRGNENTNPAVGKAQQFEAVEEARLEMVCPANNLSLVQSVLNAHHPYEEPAWEAYPLAAKVLSDAGSGRILTLKKPVALKTIISRIKKHLGLSHIRLASPKGNRSSIKTIAVCPGAGGSLFQAVPHADLFLTGEMRHHDVLARVENNSHVILTDHTNTERPYLPVFKKILSRELGKSIRIDISRVDADPLNII